MKIFNCMDLVYVYMYILLVYIRDWAMQGLVGIGCCCIYGCVCMYRVGWCCFLFVSRRRKFKVLGNKKSPTTYNLVMRLEKGIV